METVFIVHSDYLAHHGIKNQRWGQRRFQNYDGSLTSEGRARYGIGDDNRTRKEKRAAAKAKAKREKEKARQEKKKDKKATTTAEKVVKDRQKKMEYLRDHPKEMYKYRKELTEDDVKQIMEKVEFDRKLKSIRQSEIDAGWKKVDDIRNHFQTGLNAYNTTKNVYNTIAEVHNAVLDMRGDTEAPRMLKFGEKSDKSLKEFEALLRTPGGAEEVYKNRTKYSTDYLNKAYKRMATEDLLKKQIDARNKP